MLASTRRAASPSNPDALDQRHAQSCRQRLIALVAGDQPATRLSRQALGRHPTSRESLPLVRHRPGPAAMGDRATPVDRRRSRRLRLSRVLPRCHTGRIATPGPLSALKGGFLILRGGALRLLGAEGGIRTPTPLRAQVPKTCAAAVTPLPRTLDREYRTSLSASDSLGTETASLPVL